MENEPILTRLHDHQRRASEVLRRGAEAVESGSGDLRQDIGAVLQDYQVFKHEEIFNPAVRSASPEQAALAREMKIECIAAGEAFRAHVQRWTPGEIDFDRSGYRAASRLTLNAVRRHVDREREGITRLLGLLAERPAGV